MVDLVKRIARLFIILNTFRIKPRIWTVFFGLTIAHISLNLWAYQVDSANAVPVLRKVSAPILIDTEPAIEPALPAQKKTTIIESNSNIELTPTSNQEAVENNPSTNKQLITDEVDKAVEQRKGLAKYGVGLMEGTRKLVGNNVTAVATGIDSWFGGEEVEEINGSYVKIKISETFEEGGEKYQTQKVKVKLDFPRTERRLRLVFESDADDTDSLAETNRVTPSEQVKLNDDSPSSGAISYLLAESKNWRVRLDSGVRSTPLIPFTKLKMIRKAHLGEYWKMRIGQYLYYYHKEGFGAKTLLVVERHLGEHVVFKNKVEAQFQDDENNFEFAEIASLYHFLDDDSSLTYSLGVIGESQPEPRTKSYFARLRYRYRLYKQWIYLNLTPNIEFPREHYSAEASFTIKLEFRLAQEQ